MKQPLHAELSRVADGDGDGSDEARVALSDEPIAARLSAAMRALARHRGTNSSTCPSDAARAVGGDTWRDLMPDANAIARDLARSGDYQITQRGEALDPDGSWHGPIRVRIASG